MQTAMCWRIEDGETEEQRMGEGRRGDVDSYSPSGILIFELRFSVWFKVTIVLSFT